MFDFLGRRSRSRRLNRRILVAMLAVALLPLAALTGLVGADLTAVNQATVDEAHQTILAEASQRESSAATDGAATLQARLDALGGELGQLASTVDVLLRNTKPASQPVAVLPGGARLVSSPALGVATIVGSGSKLLTANGLLADALGTSRPAVAAALDAVLKHHPELSALWVYNSASAELTEAPVTDPEAIAGLVGGQRIDATHLIDSQLQAALPRGEQTPASGGGGLGQSSKAPIGPAWSDIDTAAFGTSTSVTVWTGLPARDYYIGAELPSAAIAALLPAPLSTLPDTYQVLLSPSGRWLSAGAVAGTDLSLPNGYEGTPARIPGVPSSTLLLQQAHMIRTPLHGVEKDLFTAPVAGPHWILASVVPDRELAPAVASLGDGIRNGVHRILILQVLPLAVVLGIIAVILSALFSRRLVGPVRALTASAERLAQGHVDEPVPHQGEDEVGLLSEALERMRREINSSRGALIAAAHELEGRVAERTEELRDRNEELVALNALAATLTRSLDPSELLTGAVEAIRVILPVTAAAGYTVADDGHLTLVTHHPTRLGDTRAILAGGVEAAVANGSMALSTYGARRLVAIPVAAGGPALGALAAVVPASVPVPKRIRILLGAVADQVGLALRTAQFAAEGRELAVLEERTRLAREIHDTLAQQLTGIVLQLEAAEALQSRNHNERSRELMVAAREQARLALQEARRSVWNLRPAPLEAAGLPAAVAVEVERFGSRSGITVSVRNDGVSRSLALSPQSEVAVFRILQEALANAGQHSGASHVDVELRAAGGELVLVVSDDGSGFDATAEGVPGTAGDSFGLVGMRERARLIGARFDVVSEPAGGTTVSVKVPLEQQDTAASA